MDQLIEFASNHVYLSAIWAVLVVALIYTFVAGIVSPIKEVNTHEMTQLVNKQDAVVLDTRQQKDFKTGHILGARQIKQEELRQKNFSKLEKYKSKPIIVVCAMGNSARATAAAMKKEGFEQAVVLKGGMNAWQTAGLPISK